MKMGLVGLGQMGSAMAKRLLAQGHALTVYNRSAGPAAQFAAMGAAVAPDLKTLAATVDIVFTVVSDSADVEAVVLGQGGLLSGAHADTLIVDCSTIDPQVSLKVGDAVRQAGFAMMDAPIGGRPAQAEQGKLTFMVGALAQDLERVRPVLEQLGSRVVFCGAPSMGITMKVVNNLLSQSVQLMDLEAMALGM